ncbi:MAG: arsenate reductase family protein [Bacteroidia bacterium]
MIDGYPDHQATVYYNSKKGGDAEALVYARELSESVREHDVYRTPLTSTQLKEIARLLDVEVLTLVDVKSTRYRMEYEGKDFSDADWLLAMVHNPDLMKTPIVFKGRRGLICDIPSQALRLKTAVPGKNK